MFIDELDAVGARRGAGMNEERDQTLNQLLTELDGFEGRQGILLLAATNRPEARAGPLSSLGHLLGQPSTHLGGANDVSQLLEAGVVCLCVRHCSGQAGPVCTQGTKISPLRGPAAQEHSHSRAEQVLDPALTRPGRLSRRVEVPLPDEAARAAILGVHLRGTPLQPGSDRRALCAVLARLTGGLSGAELANVVNEAALLAGRRGAEVHPLRLHGWAVLGRGCV